MKHGIDWKKKYVKVGDVVAIYPFEHRGKPYVGVVDKVHKNHFGRISYYVAGNLVCAEELFPGKNQKKLKIPFIKKESK